MAKSLSEMLAPLFAPPLQLVSVASRGAPGQERVYLRANARAVLAEYLLLVGLHVEGTAAFPSRDHVFWMGNENIDQGGWVIVYTGPGQRTLTHITETREPALVLYWNRQTTLFHDPRMVPILVRMDASGTQVGAPGQ
jgi:hypothetical protein